MAKNPANLRDVGEAVAAVVGRPLTDAEEQELSRQLQVLGVRQNPAFSQIFAVLMAARLRLEDSAQGIVTAGEQIERAAGDRIGAVVAKQIDAQAITEKVVKAVALTTAAVMVVIFGGFGLATYLLSRQSATETVTAAARTSAAIVSQAANEFGDIADKLKSKLAQLDMDNAQLAASPAMAAARDVAARPRTKEEALEIHKMVEDQNYCALQWASHLSEAGVLMNPTPEPGKGPNGNFCASSKNALRFSRNGKVLVPAN